MRRITAKGVKIGIKNGFDIVDFCDKYECTEPELQNAIKKLYSKGNAFKKTWNEIRSNKKPSHKANTPKPTMPTFNVDKDADVPHPCALVEHDEFSRIGKLKACMKEISSLSELLMQKESERESLISKHREMYKELRDINTRVEELCVKVHEEHVNAKRVMQECYDNMSKQTALWDEITVLKSELETKRREVEELKVIEISIYKDGRLESSDDINFEGIHVDDTMCDELLHDERCLNFTIREVRSLARVLKFASVNDHKVELTCDNGELEKLFHTLMDESNGSTNLPSRKNHLN